MLTIMSFNIRCECDRGTEAWALRLERLIPLVQGANPDLIGFQEVLPGQYGDLKARLPDYDSVGKARDDGENRGERTAIFYRRSRFELLTHGDFWLSGTPDVPSCGWDGACTRICTWAKLHDTVTQKELAFFNTHLDHVGKNAMVEGAKLLCSRMARMEKEALPVFVTGDFNVNEGSPAYTVMTEHFLDAKYAAKLSMSHGTFNGYRPSDQSQDKSPIDYLFLSADSFTVARYAVLVNGDSGRHASDHYPIVVSLT